jgi:hypothetical protein
MHMERGELLEDIHRLRTKMYTIRASGTEFSDPIMVKLSEKLDEKLNEYEKEMDKNTSRQNVKQ